MDVRPGATCRFRTAKRHTTMQDGVEEGAQSGFAQVDAPLKRLQEAR